MVQGLTFLSLITCVTGTKSPGTSLDTTLWHHFQGYCAHFLANSVLWGLFFSKSHSQLLGIQSHFLTQEDKPNQTRQIFSSHYSAKALQTILVLSSPQDLQKRFADKSQHLTVDWNIGSARKVLEAWQRSFTEVGRKKKAAISVNCIGHFAYILQSKILLCVARILEVTDNVKQRSKTKKQYTVKTKRLRNNLNWSSPARKGRQGHLNEGVFSLGFLFYLPPPRLNFYLRKIKLGSQTILSFPLSLLTMLSYR